MKRPNKPAASANPSRFTVTGRGQTAKAFLPAPNALSSLKSVTATLRGLVCRSNSPSFSHGLAVGGHVRLSPFAARPLAAGEPHVRRHSCFSPARVRNPCRHPSAQHFSLRHPEQGRRGLSFTVEGAAASRPSRHPISGSLPLHDTLIPLSHFLHEWERLPGGIAVGSLHNSNRLHSSVWEKSPPFRRGSPDSSKQRLQGFCSTTGTFLPPAERSNRGSTAVGSRTRFLQPLLPRSKEGTAAWGLFWIYGVLNLSLYKGKFKMLTIRMSRDHHVSGPGGRLTNTRSCPSAWLWPPRTFTKCMDAALAPLRLQGIRYWTIWMTGSFWLTSRELVSRHRDIVLGHIHSLGLRMNAKKSVLLPSQRTVFLGVCLDSVSDAGRLAPARIPVFTACLARFKLGHHVSVGTCRRLLGLMAAASPVVAPRAASHEAIPFVDEGAEVTPHCTSYSPYQSVAQVCCRHL